MAGRVTLGANAEAHLLEVVGALAPTLAGPIGPTAVTRWTVELEWLRTARRTPRAAVYVAWDRVGRCRYVGSVHRPSNPAAVASRMREHMIDPDRRGRWVVVTVFPIARDLGVEVVRACEAVTARFLHPLDGTDRPRLPVERSLAQMVTDSRPSTAA